LGHLEPSSQQLLVYLRDTALLLIPQRPDQGNHIQAKFSVGQYPFAFFLAEGKKPDLGLTLSGYCRFLLVLQPLFVWNGKRRRRRERARLRRLGGSGAAISYGYSIAR
jgi:hypothetical protein